MADLADRLAVLRVKEVKLHSDHDGSLVWTFKLFDGEHAEALDRLGENAEQMTAPTMSDACDVLAGRLLLAAEVDAFNERQRAEAAAFWTDIRARLAAGNYPRRIG